MARPVVACKSSQTWATSAATSNASPPAKTASASPSSSKLTHVDFTLGHANRRVGNSLPTRWLFIAIHRVGNELPTLRKPDIETRVSLAVSSEAVREVVTLQNFPNE